MIYNFSHSYMLFLQHKSSSWKLFRVKAYAWLFISKSNYSQWILLPDSRSSYCLHWTVIHCYLFPLHAPHQTYIENNAFKMLRMLHAAFLIRHDSLCNISVHSPCPKIPVVYSWSYQQEEIGSGRSVRIRFTVMQHTIGSSKNYCIQL